MGAFTREEKLCNLLAFGEEDFPRQIEWFLHKRKRVKLGAILLNIARIERTRAAKLCWFKGIPVKIDSPWVQMELMPIEAA